MGATESSDCFWPHVDVLAPAMRSQAFSRLPSHALCGVVGIISPGDMTMELIDTLMTALQAAPSNRSLVLFHVGGGAISRVRWRSMGDRPR